MGHPAILAPVGGTEQLTAAVRCGAEAVYLGLGDLNARRSAENFDADSLAAAAAYCRARDTALYVTVNTMLLDRERGLLDRTAEAIARAGADGVILQDFGAAELFAKRYPSIHRVASTQTAVHNLDGVRLLEDAGFQSFVLARELSLDEMAHILARTALPAEAFVHGAHCVCVSGMCALSSMLGGRSGNRGLCAQPCRLPWSCGGSGDHVLSMKDMSLLPHIRALADVGVDTLKIEGRMKRPEYVAAAVTACRAARDGASYDETILRAVFSRSGFTDAYLAGHPDGSMFGVRTKEDVTGAEGVFKDLAALYRKENPRVPLTVRFAMDGNGSRLTVSDGIRAVELSGPVPEPARTRPLDADAAARSLGKTGGTQYYVNKIETDMAGGLTLPASALNDLRRRALAALDAERSVPRPHARTDWAPAELPSHPARSTPSPLWARYADPGQAEGSGAERVILPAETLDPALVERFGDRLIAALPAVLFEPKAAEALEAHLTSLRDAGLSAVWTENLYGLPLGKRLGLAVYGGFGLNIANTRSLAVWEELGLAAAAVSFELPMGAIRALGGSLPQGIAVYGRLPLMRYRSCPIRAELGCARCGGTGSLTDRRGTAFPVECGQRRYSTLLNSVPLDISGRDDPADFRLLWFTRETPAECAAILARFRRNEPSDAPHTGGLYYRKLL